MARIDSSGNEHWYISNRQQSIIGLIDDAENPVVGKEVAQASKQTAKLSVRVTKEQAKEFQKLHRIHSTKRDKTGWITDPTTYRERMKHYDDGNPFQAMNERRGGVSHEMVANPSV